MPFTEDMDTVLKVRSHSHMVNMSPHYLHVQFWLLMQKQKIVESSSSPSI